MALLTFLHRIIAIFKHYFNELEEESIRDNFVIIYELLDEICDNGYPQFTEAKILSEFITVGAHQLRGAQGPDGGHERRLLAQRRACATRRTRCSWTSSRA